VANVLNRLVPALAGAVAGAVAVRRSQPRPLTVIRAASTPVHHAPTAPQGDEQPIPPQTGEGPGPDSPLDMPPPDWKASIKRAVKEFKDDRATLTGAGMAYYWFLSVFPAMVALVGLLGLVNASGAAIDSLTRAVQSALPGDAAKVLVDALNRSNGQSGGTSLVAALLGLALALWSASSGMVGMQMGLDVAYDVTTDRTFVKKRLVALELLVAMLVLGGTATALIVFGAPLGDALRDNLPFGRAFVVAWTLIRWTLGLAALTALFATIYYLAPNRDTPRWVWVSPGGILAAAIWLAASLGFSFYVSSFGKYAETYGSLAGVVVLLLWLYLTALAVVLGGELNAELERQSAARKGEVPLPS
jgi:membrane protein